MLVVVLCTTVTPCEALPLHCTWVRAAAGLPMGTISEIIQRADTLVEKYGRYDMAMQPRAHKAEGGGADGFEDEVQLIEEDIADLMMLAEEVAGTSNRAAAAARNAEIRRAKNELLQRKVEGLHKKARKGKNVTNEVLSARVEVIKRLGERIKAIPDGVRIAGGGPSSRVDGSSSGIVSSPSSAYTRVKGLGEVRADHYEHTDETRGFHADWQVAKARQDEALGRIEHGVGVLGNLAKDMNQELVVQEPIMQEIGTNLERVGGEVKTRNQQMKAVATKMRSTRNLCFDIALIAILLALAAYIYSLVR